MVVSETSRGSLLRLARRFSESASMALVTVAKLSTLGVWPGRLALWTSALGPSRDIWTRNMGAATIRSARRARPVALVAMEGGIPSRAASSMTSMAPG